MNIIKLLKKIKRIFYVNLLYQNAYRGRTFIWSIEGFVSAFVPASAWIFLSYSGVNPNVDTDKLVIYYFVIFALWVITAGKISWVLGNDIKSGKLSVRILKPFYTLLQYVIHEQAWKIVSATFTIPTFFFLIFAIGKWNILLSAIPNIPYFTIAVIIGAIIWIEIELMIGMAAFWLTRIDGVDTLFYAVNLIWGAQIAPMSMLPEIIQKSAYFLPFRFYFSYPAEMLLGTVTQSEFFISVFIGVVWILLLNVMYKQLYKIGLKRYEALGI